LHTYRDLQNCNFYTFTGFLFYKKAGPEARYLRTEDFEDYRTAQGAIDEALAQYKKNSRVQSCF
jgi:hypothetical protein